MEIEYNYDEEIAYVRGRVEEEGSVPLYLENEYEGERSITELVSDIISLDDQFTDMMIDEEVAVYTSDDEQNYVAEQSGYSPAIVEIVLWFYECYRMSKGYIEYQIECEKCGHNLLYIREGKDGMFSTIFECAKCKEKYTHEQIEGEEDDLLEYDFSEQLPLESKKAKALKDANETNSSYIIKAATGYRKGIWRKIQISAVATLHDLSLAVLGAFEFDYDHLYAFFMDDKLRTRHGVPAFYSPYYGYESENAAEEMLENFSFVPKQKFLFLYDFGDQWRFTMTVEKEINEVTPEAFVVQSRGESPLQYRDDWEGDDEENA